MPDMASATAAYAGHVVYGDSPLAPNPEMLRYTIRGLAADTAS